MPTIKDVAKAADVSTSTVSHVINDTRPVSSETRQRVLEAINKLGYHPNRIASNLRSQKTDTIGVLLPNSANPFFAQVLAGIEDACYDADYNLILGNANNETGRELSYLNVLLSRQVDGVLLISTGAHVESVAMLSKHETPVVLVDRSADLDTLDEIFTDNEEGGRLAARYLLSLGHQRLACITGPSFLTPSARRVAGFRDALAEAGYAVADAHVVTGDFQHEGGYNAARQLLTTSEPPTAIFACNDLMAVGALSAAHDVGLSVPDDLSVIGYDDIPLASYTTPRLTTIHQPGHKIGELAVQTLLKRIRRPDKAPEHHRLDVTLIERGTCAPRTS